MRSLMSVIYKLTASCKNKILRKGGTVEVYIYIVSGILVTKCKAENPTRNHVQI